MTAFDTAISSHRCTLSEGAFWHPERHQFLWCDILEKRLHSTAGDWQFPEMIATMDRVDASRLVIAFETRLFLFDLDSGADMTLCPPEAENSGTRSNDGRADPQGGFWIGTMGKSAQNRRRQYLALRIPPARPSAVQGCRRSVAPRRARAMLTRPAMTGRVSACALLRADRPNTGSG